MVMIMKQVILLLIAIGLLLISGCKNALSMQEGTGALDATWQDTNQPTTMTTIQTEGRGDNTIPTQVTVPPTTVPVTIPPQPTIPPVTEGMDENDKEGPAPTVTIPPAATESTEATEVPTETETQPTVPPTVPVATDPAVTTAPTEPKEEKAGTKDSEEIAAMLVAALNGYRLEQGSPTVTALPGLTEYALYRSGQLVTNFAHDTLDERAAATALEYGTLVDPALYGMTGQPYYTANAREAIARTDYGGTAQQVADYLARMTRNSASHWNYVGSAKYLYIGVGITYENGVWYCDIAVTSRNTDG